MIKAIVAGAAGRMGSRIINIIKGTEGISLAGAFEHPDSPFVGLDGESSALWSARPRAQPALDGLYESDPKDRAESRGCCHLRSIMLLQRGD